MASIAARTRLVHAHRHREAHAGVAGGSQHLLAVNAESARTVNGLVAPASRTRLIDSATKLAAPRAEPALPPRMRTCATSLDCATVASSGS
jgi:hypothetical protein